MRVVADINIVVSGLLWQGLPRRLLDLARERKITLCTSATLLAELADVIARDKFLVRVQAARLSAAALVQDYARLAETAVPAPLPAPAAIRMTITCSPAPSRPTQSSSSPAMRTFSSSRATMASRSAPFRSP
jgi:hypothetical protein